jgi:hypothetical protein
MGRPVLDIERGMRTEAKSKVTGGGGGGIKSTLVFGIGLRSTLAKG